MCSTIVLIRSLVHFKDIIFKPVVNFVLQSRNAGSFVARLTMFGCYVLLISGTCVGGTVMCLVKTNRWLSRKHPGFEVSDYSFITLGLSTIACLEGVLEYVGKLIREWHPDAFPGIVKNVTRRALMFIFGTMVIPAVAGVCLEKVFAHLYTTFFLQLDNPNPESVTVTNIPNGVEVNKIGSIITIYLVFWSSLEENEEQGGGNGNRGGGGDAAERAKNNWSRYMAHLRFWLRVYTFSIVISKSLMAVLGETLGRKVSNHVWFWMFAVLLMVKAGTAAVAWVKNYHNTVRDKRYASVHLSNYDEAAEAEINANGD